MHVATKAILSGLGVVLCLAVTTGADTVVIAHTDQAAPDGGLYGTFTDPVLNAFETLAFRADLTATAGGTDDNRAIYRADASGATVICRKGWWTPGVNGHFWSLSTPAMNNAGQVVFRGDSNDSALGVNDAVGIYRSAGLHALDKVVRGNDLGRRNKRQNSCRA